MRIIDISNLTKEQINAHFLTALEQNDETAAMWFEAGADPNYGHGDLIIYAIKNDNEELLDKLLEAGAKVNVKKEVEILFTALNDVKWIDKLINYGLNIHLTKPYYANSEINALGYAYNKNDKALAMRLIELGIDINKPIFAYNTILINSIKDNSKWLDEIINAGADVNMSDSMGDTPIMVAITHDNKEAFFKLIEAKADVDFKNYMPWGVYRNTPLMIAPNYFYVEQLVKNGADVNVCNWDGWTPLMEWIYVLSRNWNPNMCVDDAMKVIKFLLENGADTTIVSKEDGMTALKLARKIKNKELIKLIKEYSKK